MRGKSGLIVDRTSSQADWGCRRHLRFRDNDRIISTATGTVYIIIIYLILANGQTINNKIHISTERLHHYSLVLLATPL